jgi:manganese-dependent inorganic pyrophosphatase
VEVTESEVTKSEAAESEVTESEVTKSEAAESEATESYDTKAEDAKADDSEADDQKWLQELNRASIANMFIEETPVYVIGHRSPDSDTVCSAIAYARLLTMLGYQAEAAISESVNKETAFILKTAGVEAPQVLEDAAGKSIFLVDHSEYAQAAEGMEDAHIVGILDHHGVGSVTTGHQVVYEAKPIGATATIIWLDYMNYGLEIDKETATLLLGAILSDTSNLTISSVTEADRQAVDRLAGLAEIADVKEFYLALHTEALSFGDMSDEEIFFSDYKEYEASGVKFGIGLIPALDEERAKEMAERMKNALPGSFKKANVDLLYADIGIREGDVKVDYIIPFEGQSKEVFEATFPNYDEYDGTSYIFRNGGLGRKSKLVPGLTEYLNAHPHE